MRRPLLAVLAAFALSAAAGAAQARPLVVLLADQRAWKGLPNQVREWLSLQSYRSRVPGAREMVDKRLLHLYLRLSKFQPQS